LILDNAMNEFWFKPKTFGYGATPTTWQGWALVVLYFVIIAIVSAVMVDREGPIAAWIGWAVIVSVITILASRIMRHRTDGPWRWRWGRTNSRNAS
jgi:uncharacterized membrane protein YjgN (DUF898 family)